MNQETLIGGATRRRFGARCLPAVFGLLAVTAGAGRAAAPDWRSDSGWDAGKAEWALYDATRTIYGRPRSFEATIFTNTQRMDPETTTKASDGGAGSIEVFKHNVSEMIPTENYVYRFLTTSFVTRRTLEPYKLVMSSQEDCGATYRRFVVDDGTVDVRGFCYFPGAGATDDRYRRPENLAFHDALTLTLRGYPFDDPPAERRLSLVCDQTDTRAADARPGAAVVRYVGRETVRVAYGSLETHHLRVEHPPRGGTSVSDYWFAADPALRHVLVRHRGPFGVGYDLKRLEWWAYWSDPRP